MKTKAGVLWKPGEDWQIVDLDLDTPKDSEILVRWEATGICHTDEKAHDGTMQPTYPMVGGHEGAGVVEQVGSSVTRFKPGDHLVGSWIASCGHCRWCVTGHSNLCDNGASIMTGALQDGTYRFHQGGADLAGLFGLGTFSQWSVIDELSGIKIDPSIPFEVAALTGCGVVTGWGSAVYAAEVEPGDTIVVYGVGGVGHNAVQGAAYAGAKNVIAVDPNPFKLESVKNFGATHVASSAEEAQELVIELTRGVGADKTIVTPDLVTEQIVQSAYDATRKAGTIVLTGVNSRTIKNVVLGGTDLTTSQKRIQGALYGAGNPNYDVPKLLALYQAGQLKLDELITRRYPLADLQEAFEDLVAGKNVRGVIIIEH